MSEASNEGLMPDPGDQLRRARERAGVDLKEISKQTLIPVARLEALENHDFERVGGLAYATGYARSYARALGVESRPFVQSFEALFGVEKQLVEPAEFPVEVLPVKKSRGRLFFYLVILSVCAAAYYYFSSTSLSFLGSSGTVRPLSPISSSSLSETSEQQSTKSALAVDEQHLPNIESLKEFREAAQAIPEQLTVSDDDAQADAQNFQVPPEAPVMVESDRQSAPAEGESASEAEDLLVINFTDECWVEIEDAFGEVKIAQIAESGDNLQLFGTAPFNILLGNARAAMVALNGESITVPIRAGRRTARFVVGQ